MTDFSGHAFFAYVTILFSFPDGHASNRESDDK